MIVVAIAAIAALLTKIFHRGRSAEADHGGPPATEGPAPSVETATVPLVRAGRSE
jgi:hypothetical protein